MEPSRSCTSHLGGDGQGVGCLLTMWWDNDTAEIKEGSYSRPGFFS